MSEHVYKLIGLTTSIEGAIDNALARADKTVKHMDWFEVAETRGQIVNGEAGHDHVVLKLGFRLEH